jgi:hypothetical protein
VSINVKNARVEELVAKLKKQTGKGTTDLLLDLLERENERLERDFQARLEEAREQDRRIIERWKSRPLLDPRPLDEILAYDENGLPA